MHQGQDHGEKRSYPLNLERCYLIALGANLTSSYGTPNQSLKQAINFLNESGAVIRAVSSFYHTPAFPAGAGPDYVNAAAIISAETTPMLMMQALHEIEGRMGRSREQRWGQRTLDLDMIAYEDRVLPDAETHAEWRNLPLEAQMKRAPDQLILPHPRVQDRAFVLVPLAEIAPDWVHPILGLSVQQMLDAVPEDVRKQVKRIDD